MDSDRHVVSKGWLLYCMEMWYAGTTFKYKYYGRLAGWLTDEELHTSLATK